MSVKDGRKAPFVWASVAALESLREHWESERAEVRPGAGMSVYHALCELANADRARTSIGSDSGKFRTSRAEIAEKSCVSSKSVDRACRELERVGLLVIERDAVEGNNPGRVSSYTLLEPGETCVRSSHVGANERASEVPTSGDSSSHVEAEGESEVPTSLHIEKKEQLRRKKQGEKQPRPRVNRKPVTDAEYTLAAEALDAFNAAAGTGYSVDANLVPIVGRIREHPELSGEDHRGIVSAVFRVPWWSGHPGPQVIWGNAAQFERSVETWRSPAAVRGRKGNDLEAELHDLAAERDRLRAEEERRGAA